MVAAIIRKIIIPLAILGVLGLCGRIVYKNYKRIQETKVRKEMYDMEEQYVTIGTAMLLQKAGFDTPCFVYWYYDREKHERYQRIATIKTNYNTDDWWAYGAYSCPSQAVAARWLREKHRLHVFATRLEKGEQWFYAIADFTYSRVVPMGELFDSYKEAMESGIKNAATVIISEIQQENEQISKEI